jgi:hypothetical protein
MSDRARKIAIPPEADLALQKGNIVEAIKWVRIKNGISLVDAKRAVAAYQPRSEQATAAHGVPIWLSVVLALISIYPFFYEAVSVMMAASMQGHCVAHGYRSLGAVCSLWPSIGAALFDAQYAYLGYVSLMGLLGSAVLGLAYLLYKR